MTPLEHSDHILMAKPGEWLRATKPVTGAVQTVAGGRAAYAAGTRFRVEHSNTVAGFMWCLDERALSVSFSREEMAALERAT